ncbi:PREDICTED: taste receptor type 2 member 13-like [Chinchilla lanigera]|uniref:taste receptor type 2 member 13-like n=1 Tax=Chinchilla lanigera TaxID=34839 RepID=UPI0006963385|nr:PREDICTED: taste receptor type 2 member 13-like [Chinchilla lanigera]
MESGLQSLLNLLIVVQFITGNLSNGFIVLINLIDWVNKRKLSSVDQILIILAISRIGVICEILVSLLKPLHYSFSTVDREAIKIATFTWVVFHHFSLWLATILSIFYLLKIASFSRPIFLYLKWRVKKVILIILLGTLLFLFLNMIQINTHIEDWKHGRERNTTRNSTVSDSASLSKLIIFNMTMFSLTPFLVALISSLLLIISLWKHLQKMQLNCKGHRDPRTKAHIDALKIVVSFLLLYTSYFLSLFLSWVFQMPQSGLVHALSLTISLIYPSGHSLILILGNSKMRQAFLFVLSQLKCGTKDKDQRITTL